MLFRRNRYVDATAGRFTQEDPIGLAGGLNLFGFAAGDPVSYDDPYGLRVCAREPEMREAIAATYRVQITWRNGCVADVRDITPEEGTEETHLFTRGDLYQIVASNETFNFWFRTRGNSATSRFFWEEDFDITISKAQAAGLYGAWRPGGGCMKVGPWSISQLIAHEVGHAVEGAHGRPHGDRAHWKAIVRENKWIAANNALTGGSREFRTGECPPR